MNKQMNDFEKKQTQIVWSWNDVKLKLDNII